MCDPPSAGPEPRTAVECRPPTLGLDFAQARSAAGVFPFGFAGQAVGPACAPLLGRVRQALAELHRVVPTHALHGQRRGVGRLDKFAGISPQDGLVLGLGHFANAQVVGVADHDLGLRPLGQQLLLRGGVRGRIVALAAVFNGLLDVLAAGAHHELAARDQHEFHPDGIGQPLGESRLGPGRFRRRRLGCRRGGCDGGLGGSRNRRGDRRRRLGR